MCRQWQSCILSSDTRTIFKNDKHKTRWIKKLSFKNYATGTTPFCSHRPGRSSNRCLTIRFDADVFDENERLATDCIALYKGGSVFEKEILYWIDYDVIADRLIRRDDCSQAAYKEQMHTNIFHVIGLALVEMFSDWYGQGDEAFDTLIDNLPEGALRSLLQGHCNPEQESALSEEFAACHWNNRNTDSALCRFCSQYLSQIVISDPTKYN